MDFASGANDLTSDELQPLIRVEDLYYRYPIFDPGAEGAAGREPEWALAGVSFAVSAGEVLGVTGTTSSGKTTLCLALVGLVPQMTSGTIRGDVWIGDWNTKRTRVPQLATRVGLVFQDPEANLVGLAVEDELAFGAENLAVEPAEIDRRVTWALDVVGMSEYRQRPVEQLSGGQKQRVGIASVLVMQPQVLVLDEPTAELDPRGKRGVTDAIMAVRRQVAEMAIVMVESNAEVLARVADRVTVLDQGQQVALNTPTSLYANPAPLLEMGVAVPQLSQLAAELGQATGLMLPSGDISQVAAALRAGLT